MHVQILNLRFSDLVCFCVHGLCKADVTAGREPNAVSHIDSQVVLYVSISNGEI